MKIMPAITKSLWSLLLHTKLSSDRIWVEEKQSYHSRYVCGRDRI